MYLYRLDDWPTLQLHDTAYGYLFSHDTYGKEQVQGSADKDEKIEKFKAVLPLAGYIFGPI